MDKTERLLRAVQLATRKLASSGNFDDLLKDVLAICVQAVGATGGTIYLHDPETKRLKFQHVLPEDVAMRLPMRDIPEDYGAAGQAFQDRQTIRREFPEKPASEWNDFERATGVPVQSMIATPLAMEQETPIGVVQLLNKRQGVFNDTDASVLDTISAVATMAYLNFQLTDEMARASSLLGMGKVSHDIGNLSAALYATLSFSDMAMHGLRDHLMKGAPDETVKMYVEALDPMFDELKGSVDRLVHYSRLISDISAGRPVRPNMVLSPMAETIHDSAAYHEADSRTHHIAIRYDIQPDAPPTMHDALYVSRIVQNLVGNAVKAVSEAIPDELEFGPGEGVYGEIVVRYRFVGASHRIEVQDSGLGMSKETADRILQGNARSQWMKATGSGWGTRIVLELTAAHNGTVSIDSEIGKGTTFRVCIPHNPG